MLAEILSAHWPAYVAKFGRLIPAEQHAAVRAILRCRTPALGGQRYRCACGREHFAYHSCNHRACPRCGQADAAQWLARQRTRLLPVPYFLVTFTVPEQLREPIRAAMKPWYGALLKEGSAALQDLAAQPKHLGAELGLTAVALGFPLGDPIAGICVTIRTYTCWCPAADSPPMACAGCG